MFFDINNHFSYSISLNFFKKILRKIASSIKFPSQGRISIAFVDRKTIKKLNKFYRRVNKATSILSFAEENKLSRNFVSHPEVKNYLGEIIICHPEVSKRAKKNKRSTRKELIYLLIHGMAHLAGYNHRNERGAKIMERIEREIMTKIISKQKL